MFPRIWRKRLLNLVRELELNAWVGGPPQAKDVKAGDLVIVELTHDAAKREQLGKYEGKPIIVMVHEGYLQPTVGTHIYQYREISRWRHINLSCNV